MLDVKLGKYKQEVDGALQRMAEQRVIQRIWSHDHTVWKPEPTEITNRLGWLRIAEESKRSIDRLTGLADELRQAGYRRAVLLGMGGSSLAPEVFAKTFGPAEGYLDVSVIDSTCPLVSKIHTIITEYKEQDHIILIAGKKNHPEVVGLRGYAGAAGYVIETPEELLGLSLKAPVVLVVQSTFDVELHNTTSTPFS